MRQTKRNNRTSRTQAKQSKRTQTTLRTNTNTQNTETLIQETDKQQAITADKTKGRGTRTHDIFKTAGKQQHKITKHKNNKTCTKTDLNTPNKTHTERQQHKPNNHNTQKNTQLRQTRRNDRTSRTQAKQ